MANRKHSDIPENVWNAMRTEYISSDNSSYRQLEKNYGVSFNKIRKRSLEEDWQGKRENLSNAVAITVFEALRQLDFPHLQDFGKMAK